MTNLSHKQLLAIDKNHQQAAKAASLYYVTDKDAGIMRHKKADNFFFTYLDKPVKDKEQLERIRKLAIPPSWSEVWICYKPNGHIQATGLDLNKRKQYRYHADWSALRTQTKFHHLYEFGKALPVMRKKLKRDLSQHDLNENKVLATVINLMELTYIRIGNNGYEKLYGSYGLTTLKDKHVKISNEAIQFSFTGKKGVNHNISLKNKKLARIVKECRDIPGRELFQYYDDNGTKRQIDSGMVNNYIKEAAGQDFSAKDFRTWAGSLHALQSFCSLEEVNSSKDLKKNVVTVLDEVSKKLGNTRTVCRKYYVHPALIQLYEENKLNACMGKNSNKIASANGLTVEENNLMHVLKKAI
ncbi:MAG: DNA topoisomerase IB [Chitinophagaceae bacterium]